MNDNKQVRRLALGLLGFAFSFALGACFDGAEARGLACTDDAQCGLDQQCINGFCDGIFLCDGDEAIDASLVCDFIVDCPDGEDEDPNLCFEADDLFECSDGTVILYEWLCDGEPDCPDGDDEVGCVGAGLNQCTGADSGPDIAYEGTEPTGPTLINPMPQQLVQLVGPMEPEVLVASAGSNQLDIIELGDMGMNNALGPFDDAIIDFALGEVNGDSNPDIVIATQGDDGFTAYVYQNNAPADPPSLYGEPLIVSLAFEDLPEDLPDLPDPLPDPLPEAFSPEVQAIGLGRLNNDSSIDMVALVDAGEFLGNGRLVVSEGSPANVELGGSYFTPELAIVPALGYSMLFDTLMVDVDDNGFDDVVVSAQTNDGFGIWVIHRVSEDLQSGWADPEQIEVMGMGMGGMGGLPVIPAELSVATFQDGMGPDLVSVDPISGRIQTFRNIDGMFVASPPVELEIEAELIGVAASDVNCDARDDFLFYQNNSVHVYLGDGNGGVESTTPIVADFDGIGRGRVGVAQIDEDGTPDIVVTMEGDAGVQVLLSTGYAEGPFGEADEEDEEE